MKKVFTRKQGLFLGYFGVAVLIINFFVYCFLSEYEVIYG